MRALIYLKSAMALIASCTKSVGRNFDKMTDSGVPKRDGHRAKAKQRVKKYGEKFRRMIKIYGQAKLPKGIHAPGFESYTNIGGTVYLVKHGTHYRMDKLSRSGRVTFSAA